MGRIQAVCNQHCEAGSRRSATDPIADIRRGKSERLLHALHFSRPTSCTTLSEKLPFRWSFDPAVSVKQHWGFEENGRLIEPQLFGIHEPGAGEKILGEVVKVRCFGGGGWCVLANVCRCLAGRELATPKEFSVLSVDPDHMSTIARRACASLRDIAGQADWRRCSCAHVVCDIPLEIAPRPRAAAFEFTMSASPSSGDSDRAFGTWLVWCSVDRLYDKGTILHQFDQESRWLRQLSVNSHLTSGACKRDVKKTPFFGHRERIRCRHRYL